MHTNCYLSIISPFYNSKEKCTRLLVTLSKIDDPEVEIIFVDDGSTDGTYDLLQSYVRENTNVKLYKQENKGPGGARNEGLKHANGKYVWFVDSDDDIRLEAIKYLKEKQHLNYDFIDFDFFSTTGLINTMEINYGEYNASQSVNIKQILLKNFGSICTKMLRRELLLENKIYYPEFCLFEDNPLTFIYPFYINSFLKADQIGYIHHTEYESVTRTKLNHRYFDRKYTAIYGLKRGYQLAQNETQIKILQEKFNLSYIGLSTGYILLSETKKIDKYLLSLRLMRNYRYVAKKLGVSEHPLHTVYNKFDGQKFRLAFTIIWALSFLLIDNQTKFFEDIRIKAWGKPFIEPLY